MEVEASSLHLRVFEFFPGEVMGINGIVGWGNQDSLLRSENAHRLLREWPSLSEVLQQVATTADDCAAKAMKRRALVVRKTRASQEIAFVRALAIYFTSQFDRPLYGTIAAIATVALGRPIEKASVAQAVTRQRKG